MAQVNASKLAPGADWNRCIASADHAIPCKSVAPARSQLTGCPPVEGACRMRAVCPNRLQAQMPRHITQTPASSHSGCNESSSAVDSEDAMGTSMMSTESICPPSNANT